MGTKVSDRPGSLAGYDIVLAVSEEAINAQLQKLYNTKLAPGRLPRPTKLPSWAPAPQSKYLINHDLSLHPIVWDSDEGSRVRDPGGIDGHIECPRIVFRARDNEKDSLLGHSNVAYVELTFKRDENAPEGEQDSLLYYIGGVSILKRKKLVINGYKLSWQVVVDQKVVQDVMKDLVKASKDPNNQTTLPDDTVQQLQTVDPKIFTVSSIFCLFQETRIVDSFLVRGPDGEPLTAKKEPDIVNVITAFKNKISTYFAEMQKECNGAPSVDNPFVLGYSISQKIPEIRDFDPSASNRGTPVYFQPKQWSLSTTPGKKKNGSELTTTSGTLNYCMLTHREGNNTPVVIDPTDKAAGVFPKTFFDTTKSFGRTKDSNGHVQGCDGIMGFSKAIFSDLWLAAVARSMIVRPNMYINMIVGMVHDDILGDINIDLVEDSVDTFSTQSLGLGQGRGATLNWHLKDIMLTPIFGNSLQRMSRASGKSKVLVTYTSDTRSIKNLEDGIDHSRKIYLDIIVENYMSLEMHTLGGQNWIQYHQSPTDWLKSRETECRNRTLIRVEISSGSVGKWSIRVNETASKNLPKPGSNLEWQDMDAHGEQEFGNFDRNRIYYEQTFFGLFKFREHVNIFREWMNPDTTAEIVGRNLDTAFKDQGTKIIMPAGNVFTFAGLDTDSQGNLYSQVNYANEGGVEVKKAG